MDATLKPERSDPVTFAGGRYVVRRLLGEGSQKVVYLVHDASSGLERALSLIKLGAVAEEDVRRLHREAEAMARLGAQPHVVTLLEIGEEHGRPYLVSEYVAGGDLRAELRSAGGLLPVERAIDIALDIADGLAAAHAQGIVHRDIKPANIWLGDDGNAKLGDFGLAYALDRSRLTMTGAMLGTAAYMPPEQALGQPVDERGDLYALGVVLYEMITGRPPFVGDDALAIVSQHIHSAPVEPSWHNARTAGALEALVLRLLAKVPARRPAEAARVAQELRQIRESPSAAADAPPPLDDLQGLGWGRFVGRDAEMGQLKEALDGAFSQAGTTMMLVGEPGIGKTRLAEEFSVFATLRGARVLRGRFVETEFASPYGAFVEALSEYVNDRLDGALRDELLDDAPQMLQLLPLLRERFADIGPPPAVEGEEGRVLLMDAVVSVLARAAQAAPIVMILDDLHWADLPSLMMLERIARAAKEARILLVGIYRDVELDRAHPLSAVAARLRRDGITDRVLLRGLSEESIREMLDVVQQAAVDSSRARAALVEMIYRETEGNPLFVREVLSHLVEEGKIYRENNRWRVTAVSATELGIPDGVRDVIGRRISRLSNGCSRILARACAMPGGFSWDELRAICREDDDTLLEYIDEALAAQMIVERRAAEHDAYTFTHALIRSALYDELTPPRRIQLHRNIGQALEQLYETDIEARLAMLAEHYFRAAAPGQTAKAIEYSRRAAEQATALFAFEEAGAHYQRALDAMDIEAAPPDETRCLVLLDLADSNYAASRYEVNVDVLRDAADLAHELGSTELFARAAMTFDTNTRRVERDLTEERLAKLDEALRMLEGRETRTRAMVLCQRVQAAKAFANARAGLASVGFLAWAGEKQQNLLDQAQEALALAKRLDDGEVVAMASYYLHACMWAPENSRERFDVIDAGLKAARKADSPIWEVQMYGGRIADLLDLGEIDEFMHTTKEYAALVERLRFRQEMPFVPAFPVAVEIAQGQLTLAEAHMDEYRANTSGDVMNAIVYVGQLFFLRHQQGRLGEIEPVYKAALARWPGLPTFRSMLALILASAGKSEEAIAELKVIAQNDFRTIPRDLFWMQVIVLTADTCAELGEVQIADHLYDLLLPHHETNATGVGVGSFGSVARVLLRLATLLGRWDDAERHFRTALRVNEKQGFHAWVAWTRLAYGEMLLTRDRPGDREAASGQLAVAIQTASECGMAKVVKDATRLAGRTSS